ncbi:unnamed protein product [Brassicogethes aeneus]|uniref:Carboxylic ester hydrolase n=1 Tax=Brassicogethes aeneus TaxID=1431903 RepID=A0A9P0AU31_BRAAE|nr:unnamed protein product [Brassicogethes aeneus]
MVLIKIFFIIFLFKSVVIAKHKVGKNRDSSTDPVVTLEDGILLGKNEKIPSNKTYYSFEGIPFAKPPLGQLRFEPPQPNEKWNGTLLAKTNKSSCIQFNGDGSEDCLYLNVYTPNLTQNLPVMVWIYGGAFINGDGSKEQQNPENILEEDVVVVHINYRLGIFGFLSTNDMAAPGNTGLKDQVLALEWVQKNIAHFGGNPKNVTIFGESAGAASVSYLVQSNLTKGLFHRAIIQSGSSLCLWSLSRYARKLAFDVGENLNIYTSNSSKLVDELKKVKASDLHSETKLIYSLNIATINIRNGLPIGPVMEPDHKGAVFSNKSYELLSKGIFNRVPLIIGHTSQEALAAGDLPFLVKFLLGHFTSNRENFTPIDMNIKNPIESLYVGLKIKYHYFGFNLVSRDSRGLTQFLSDDQFNRPISKTVGLQSQYVPVYYYVFSYVGKSGQVKNKKLTGVGHAGELQYIFTPKYGNMSQSDMLTIKRTVKLWTNFAKYGNPTPSKDALFDNEIWIPNFKNSSGNLNYYNINQTLSNGINPNEANIQFFQNLYNKYGNPPYDTY